jgi:IS4 transposase
MRELQAKNSLFLIRVRDNAKVYWDERGMDIRQKDLAREIGLGREVGKIKYHKKQARLFVNECDITIKRDYSKMITDKEGKRRVIRIPGDPIKGRFIVSRVVNSRGKVLATWMLITNEDKRRVDGKTIATWYYYRWSIESYFKLLKTTGFNLERWQQVKPIALFKRLIVVAYAIILVFKLANSDDENAGKIREFLIKLSGKVMERGVEYTLPALLTGFWVFLRVMDVLDNFSKEELDTLKEQAQHIIEFELFDT